jgi:DNA-binding NarL/FixJ family response regulator
VVNQKRNDKKFRQLSDRNKEVLALIGRCKKADEIGEELFIGVNTVNSHKKTHQGTPGNQRYLGIDPVRVGL